ncbi:MAG: hypothetical protein K8R36_19540 [Planctomycetales bacterium]|nr:hypothetical protein [Planctomycetales bacterium]
MRTLPIRATLAFAAGGALLCMLGFYSLLSAAPPGSPPFEDAGTQREEMIRELREIKELIKEQNALLKDVIAVPNGRSKTKK